MDMVLSGVTDSHPLGRDFVLVDAMKCAKLALLYSCTTVELPLKCVWVLSNP